MAKAKDEQAAIETTEPQMEAFPIGMLAGEGVHLKTLIKPNHSIVTSCALSRAKVPLVGGLLDPNGRARLLVTVRSGKLHPLPLRANDATPDEVTGWDITQDLNAQHVENVPGTDRELMLHKMRAMLDDAPQAAGAVLDELSAMVAAELAPA